MTLVLIWISNLIPMFEHGISDVASTSSHNCICSSRGHVDFGDRIRAGRTPAMSDLTHTTSYKIIGRSRGDESPIFQAVCSQDCVLKTHIDEDAVIQAGVEHEIANLHKEIDRWKLQDL